MFLKKRWKIAGMGVAVICLLLSGCSEKSDEPILDPQGETSPESSRTPGVDGREIVEDVYRFDDGFVVLQQPILNPPGEAFVPLHMADGSACAALRTDDIRIIAAYSYDIPKFGTGDDPWIDLMLDPVPLPASVQWLTVEAGEKDGSMGLYLTYDYDFTGCRYAECGLKLELEIGINDNQCTRCTLQVALLQDIDNFPQPVFDDKLLLSYSQGTPIHIPASGASGSITMRYNPEGVAHYRNLGYDAPDEVELQHVAFSKRIGYPTTVVDGIQELDDDWYTYFAWQIVNDEGVCELAGSRIRIIDNPDGSKTFDYSIPSNNSGMIRQIKISDMLILLGEEYTLCRRSICPIYWYILLQQDPV